MHTVNFWDSRICATRRSSISVHSMLSFSSVPNDNRGSSIPEEYGDINELHSMITYLNKVFHTNPTKGIMSKVQILNFMKSDL